MVPIMNMFNCLYSESLFSEKISKKGKTENDIPFIRILVYINSILSDSFSPSNHISAHTVLMILTHSGIQEFFYNHNW
jgi:hypothetical protein